VQLLKSDIDGHHSAVDYINECCQLSVGSDSTAVTPRSAVSVSADNLADVNQRYESLASDVNCHLSELSQLEPRWKHFDESVSDVNNWLKVQRDHIPRMQEAAQGPSVSQAAVQCQVWDCLRLLLYSCYFCCCFNL